MVSAARLQAKGKNYFAKTAVSSCLIRAACSSSCIWMIWSRRRLGGKTFVHLFTEADDLIVHLTGPADLIAHSLALSTRGCHLEDHG
jgi:hypothetical protein